MSDFWEGYKPEPTRPAPITTDMALDLALEALEEAKIIGGQRKADVAITAIKQALAAPVQEPVAWRFTGIAGFKRFVTDAQHKGLPLEVRSWYEPFKCASCITPPAAQRQWVGLTDEERKFVRNSVGYNQFVTAGEYAEHVQKATEAKLKERNT